MRYKPLVHDFLSCVIGAGLSFFRLKHFRNVTTPLDRRATPPHSGNLAKEQGGGNEQVFFSPAEKRRRGETIAFAPGKWHGPFSSDYDGLSDALGF